MLVLSPDMDVYFIELPLKCNEEEISVFWSCLKTWDQVVIQEHCHLQ